MFSVDTLIYPRSIRPRRAFACACARGERGRIKAALYVFIYLFMYGVEVVERFDFIL